MHGHVQVGTPRYIMCVYPYIYTYIPTHMYNDMYAHQLLEATSYIYIEKCCYNMYMYCPMHI